MERDKFGKPISRGTFPHNMQKMSGEDEIARSILNNGFLTIAHNWAVDDENKFIRYFKKLRASTSFISILKVMFVDKGTYDARPGAFSGMYDWEREDMKEGAWENMCHTARQLEKLAKKEKLYDKMKKQVGW